MGAMQGVLRALLTRPDALREGPAAGSFVIEGDDRPGPDNVGVVIPAGVAHALQSISSKDLLMVYGTSTTFVPANEGRIRSSVEAATVPPAWEDYFHAS